MKDKKIKVLHVIKTLSLGGAESNLCNLVSAFDKEIVESHIAYSYGGPYEEQLQNNGIQLYRYARRQHKVKSFASLAIIFKLVVYLRKKGIQVVHTHNYNAHVWASIAAKLAGVKVLEHVHDSRYESNAFLRERGLPETSQFKQAPYFAKYSDRVKVLTPANRDYLINEEKFPKEKVELLLNGIPLGGEPTPDFELKATLGIPHSGRVIFSAMRLSLEKNAGFLLEIAKCLKTKKNLYFVIAGDGPEKAVLEQQAKQLGLEKNVLFIGFRRDIKELLSISDLFVLPTLRELHSLSMIEAMSMYVPVLVSKGAGCNDDFIENAKSGFLLDPTNAKEWAKTIEILLADERRRIMMAQAGRQLVEEKCDIRKVTASLSKDYFELCGVAS